MKLQQLIIITFEDFARIMDEIGPDMNKKEKEQLIKFGIACFTLGYKARKKIMEKR
jgi:hypothetical protein